MERDAIQSKHSSEFLYGIASNTIEPRAARICPSRIFILNMPLLLAW